MEIVFWFFWVAVAKNADIKPQDSNNAILGHWKLGQILGCNLYHWASAVIKYQFCLLISCIRQWLMAAFCFLLFILETQKYVSAGNAHLIYEKTNSTYSYGIFDFMQISQHPGHLPRIPMQYLAGFRIAPGWDFTPGHPCSTGNFARKITSYQRHLCAHKMSGNANITTFEVFIYESKQNILP